MIDEEGAGKPSLQLVMEKYVRLTGYVAARSGGKSAALRRRRHLLPTSRRPYRRVRPRTTAAADTQWRPERCVMVGRCPRRARVSSRRRRGPRAERVLFVVIYV